MNLINLKNRWDCVSFRNLINFSLQIMVFFHHKPSKRAWLHKPSSMNFKAILKSRIINYSKIKMDMATRIWSDLIRPVWTEPRCTLQKSINQTSKYEHIAPPYGKRMKSELPKSPVTPKFICTWYDGLGLSNKSKNVVVELAIPVPTFVHLGSQIGTRKWQTKLLKNLT